MRSLPRNTLTSLLLLGALQISSTYAASQPAMHGEEGVQRADASFITDAFGSCADDPISGTRGQSDAFGGKPISLLAGAETYAKTDLTIGSIFPISVSRRYDSRSVYDSPIGFGWAINYDRRIYTYPDGSVTLRKECGWKRRFTFSGGNYVTPIGETGILVKNVDGSFTYWSKNGSRDEYDLAGKLSAVYDAGGNALQFFYEPVSAPVKEPLTGILPANIDQNNPVIVAYNYRLSRIEEVSAAHQTTGAAVDFYYDSNGRLTDIRDSAQRIVTYTHDTNGYGNLTAVTGPNGSATYGYTDPSNKHLLTSVDEGSGAYVNTYENGKVKTQTHGSGTIAFDYVTQYKKTVMTTTILGGANGPLTQTRTVEFDTLGQPAKVTDTLGNVTIYVRDSNAWILAEGHYDVVTGVTTTNAYTYDAKGNVLTKTEAQGTALEKTTTYTYHPVFNGVLTEAVQSVVESALVSVVTYSYDAATGNLLSRQEAGYLGNGTPYTYTTSYTYYPGGKIWTIDGPRTNVSDITTYEYTPQGYLWKVNQPLIGTTTYSSHDSLGNPQTVTDPNGQSTSYTYYANGALSTVTAPGNTNATQYFYVSGSCGASCGGSKIDHIILPKGNTIWYTYDSMGNLSSIKDSQNNTINYTYDSEGNKLTEQIKDSAGVLQKSLSYSYDALNRLKRITNPDNSYTEYDYFGSGSRKSARNPNGNTTNYTYDSLNRLAAVVQPGSVDTVYGYNSNSNLTSVKDDNDNTTTYIYDDKGRVYQVISPDTGTTTYAYDEAGNLVSKTDASGVTISYTYDARNRLTLIDFPSDTDTTYTYDTCPNGKGRLCSMTDASGTTTYTYTAKGQVRRETKVIDGRTYITEYTYDQHMNMKTMTYPSGKVITYDYRHDRVENVLNGAANLATSIAYKPFGGMRGITYGNGLSGTASYDTQYRVTGITAGAVMNLSYPTYDSNGNINTIADMLVPAKSRTFTYDALDRLETATGPRGSLGWTYDGVGNRQTENTNTYTYFPNTNKLSSANGNAFGYDSNGNTIAEGARQFVYNQNQRLIQVVDSGVTKGEYTYNGNGQRVKKIAGGVTTIFHYSQSGQIIAESNSVGIITAEYVYLNGQLLAKMEGASTYYYHNDHLATPQKMTDSTGTVVWAADYKPFGEATITVSTITNNLHFPGQYRDVETGSYYNYWRYYNPSSGRYWEADRIGLAGGINLYTYVRGNPMKRIDPLGLWDNDVHSGIGNKNRYGTYTWAMEAGFSSADAKIIALANSATDTGPWSNWLPLFGDQTRHFNQPYLFANNVTDTRDYWAEIELRRAVRYAKEGNCRAALGHLGKGLHSIQDKPAHRDWDTGLLGWNAHPEWYDVWSDPRNRATAESTATMSRLYLLRYLSLIWQR